MQHAGDNDETMYSSVDGKAVQGPKVPGLVLLSPPSAPLLCWGLAVWGTTDATPDAFRGCASSTDFTHPPFSATRAFRRPPDTTPHTTTSQVWPYRHTVRI